MGRTLMILTLLASAACLVSAQVSGTEQPEVPVPQLRGGAPPPDPVTNYAATGGGSYVQNGADGTIIRNGAGSAFLQNGAGSIYTRSDGRRVLVGAGGQVIVTRPRNSNSPDSDEDLSLDDDDANFIAGSSGNLGGNVVINGGHYGGGGGGGGGGNVIINGRNYGNGGGGLFINGDQTARVVDGGLQLTEGGRDYLFKPRAPGVTEQEQVDINGQPATVYYEQGGVRIERQDGSVLAYGINGEGFFMGNKESYANRKQILEDIPRQTAQIHKEVQRTLANVQQELQQQLSQWRF